jgi:hypothetical protein
MDSKAPINLPTGVTLIFSTTNPGHFFALQCLTKTHQQAWFPEVRRMSFRSNPFGCGRAQRGLRWVIRGCFLTSSKNGAVGNYNGEESPKTPKTNLATELNHGLH